MACNLTCVMIKFTALEKPTSERQKTFKFNWHRKSRKNPSPKSAPTNVMSIIYFNLCKLHVSAFFSTVDDCKCLRLCLRASFAAGCRLFFWSWKIMVCFFLHTAEPRNKNRRSVIDVKNRNKSERFFSLSLTLFGFFLALKFNADVRRLQV